MGNRRTICICDDDAIFTYLTRHTITSTGLEFDVIDFENGSNLLKFVNDELAANRRLPDIILLDINMPIMTGWEFLDEFDLLNIAEESMPSVYIFSSTSFHGDIQKANTYKAVQGFITKPLTIEKMIEISENLK